MPPKSDEEITNVMFSQWPDHLFPTGSIYLSKLSKSKIFGADIGTICLWIKFGLPARTIFRNSRHVWLTKLRKMSAGIEFHNEGNVHLESLLKLPVDVVFRNTGDVVFGKLKDFGNTRFENGGKVSDGLNELKHM